MAFIPDHHQHRPSLIRQELRQILDRFDAADRCVRAAQSIPDREAAEEKRRAAEGDHWAATEALADLFLLLMRQAIRHRPEAARLYLTKLLEPELDALAEGIIAAERGQR